MDSIRRTKRDTLSELRSQFVTAGTVGGMTAFKQQRTASGIKDTFQSFFIDSLFLVARKKGMNKEQKQKKISELMKSFPEEARTTSPVWRIKSEFSRDLYSSISS
jgi:hypothetical protein